MATQHDAHTLNACLARVIGIQIITGDCEGSEVWVFHQNGEPNVWSPLHDANQMEEVEAWLVEQGYSIDYHKWAHKKEYHFNIYHPKNSVTIQGWQAEDPDKKRAFALAIWEMEKGK